MMTTKGFESSCFGVEDIRLRKFGAGGRKQLIFVTYVTEECYYKKKKPQNYAHISPLQKANLPLQKLANLALG